MKIEDSLEESSSTTCMSLIHVFFFLVFVVVDVVVFFSGWGFCLKRDGFLPVIFLLPYAMSLLPDFISRCSLYVQMSACM